MTYKQLSMIMVDSQVVKKVLFKNSGQALFEMIIFLPFLMFLYTIYYTVGNSISGSINQQKSVRGYFYNLVKGNSYIVNLNDLKSFKGKGLKKIGFGSLGWKDYLVSDNPMAPCFKFSSLLKNDSKEECEGQEREEEGKSRFIRIFTYYGVCGPTYTESLLYPDSFEINASNQGLDGTNSCILSK